MVLHMDLGKALQDLYAERQRLEHIITALQELQQGDDTTPRRRPTGAERERRKRCKTGRRPSGIAAA
jgi:hypothetical protein